LCLLNGRPGDVPNVWGILRRLVVVVIVEDNTCVCVVLIVFLVLVS